MKGEVIAIDHFLAINKRFNIPIYQRAYSWGEEECRQLFFDIERTKGKISHFFGSLVVVPDSNGLVVIDGQQRLTTISLLLLALKCAFSSGKKPSQVHPDDLDSMIYEEFLYNKWANPEDNLRLHLVQDDAEIYTALFNSPDYVSESKIVKNFHLFQSLLEETDLTADEIMKAIENLIIVQISIDKSDNPQLIFESINSTGLGLTEGDKIRNFVLMDLDYKDQSNFYIKYWKKIEKLTARSDHKDGVGLFVRDFLTADTTNIPNLGRTYAEFKKYCNENPELFENREELFKKMLSFAEDYNKILDPASLENSSNKIAQCLDNINKQEISPSYPFILQVFSKWRKGELSEEQVYLILSIVDSFAFRRQMCDLPSNSLNKIFTDLDKAIGKLDNNVPYEDRMKRILLDKVSNARFPGDPEFKQAMIDKNVYGMRMKNRAYLFARLENGINKDALVFGTRDVAYSKIINHDYTIEHIMPQAADKSSAWRKSLEDRFEDTFKTWLHRLGNLTLTAYNSKYGNKSFQEKKTGRTFKQLFDPDFGYDESSRHLWLNQFLAKQEKWTEREIERRAKMLAERALEIWPMIATDFTPKSETKEFSIHQDDPNFFTGSTPISFTIEENVFPVTNWVDLYLQVAEYLYRKNPEPMLSIASSETGKGLSYHLRTKSSTACKQIGEGVAIFKNTSTANKINVLTRLLERYNISDMTVTLAPNRAEAEVEYEEDKTAAQQANLID